MRIVATAVLLMLTLMVPAEAGGCTKSAAAPLQANGQTFYLTTENGVSLYEETNGRPDLQRRDLLRDDTNGGNCFKADTKRL